MALLDPPELWAFPVPWEIRDLKDLKDLPDLLDLKVSLEELDPKDPKDLLGHEDPLELWDQLELTE